MCEHGQPDLDLLTKCSWRLMVQCTIILYICQNIEINPQLQENEFWVKSLNVHMYDLGK